MNAMTLGPIWHAWWTTARRARLKRRQAGFVLYGADRRPGLPPRVANAHARFEHDARMAMRDWLML